METTISERKQERIDMMPSAEGCSVIIVKRVGIIDKRRKECQNAISNMENLISKRIANSPRLEFRRRPEL